MADARKLLVVDDDPVVRKYVALAVAGWDVEIVEAADGVEALRIARDWQPDMILLDNMLPGELDGFQTCRSLREGPHIGGPRIVMMSACGDPGDIEEGLMAGADLYLIKPVNPSKIKQALSEPRAQTQEDITQSLRDEPADAGLNTAVQDDQVAGLLPRREQKPNIRPLLILLATILIGEFAIMMLLPLVSSPYAWAYAMVDAILLSLICYPVMHFFWVRPMKRHIARLEEVEEELRLAAAAFNSSEAIMITDASAKIVKVNRTFERITGYCESEVKGQTPRIFKSGRHPPEFYKQMWNRLTATGSWRGEIWDRHKKGNIYPKEVSITDIRNKDGRVSHYVSIFKDVSARKRTEEELYTLAYYDPLTGLPNRRMLLGQMNISLALARASRQYGALILVGIDQFKLLNDTMGCEHGDQLLLEARRRLGYLLPAEATLARLGGDEFAILLDRLSVEEETASCYSEQLAQSICDAMAVPYLLDGMLVHKSSSVGCALFAGDTSSSEEVVKLAGIALQHAKSIGTSKICMFSPEMQQSLELRAELESELRQAISRGNLKLHYQLQTDSHQHCLGAEALLRWEHPRRGSIPPSVFIPIAEASSLILDIGNWVIDTACAQLAEWARIPKMQHLHLAINVSAQQFKQSNFVEQVEDAVIRHGIDPSRLKLEITESISLEDIDYAVRKISALRDKVGLRLSLDDFGTGYSSLSYLKRLPFDQIKIDQSFVRDVIHNPSDAIMIKTIISMARNFNFDVVAEGVETQAQFEFLCAHGCLAYQGYLFSKPLPLEEFERLIPEIQIAPKCSSHGSSHANAHA